LFLFVLTAVVCCFVLRLAFGWAIHFDKGSFIWSLSVRRDSAESHKSANQKERRKKANLPTGNFPNTLFGFGVNFIFPLIPT